MPPRLIIRSKTLADTSVTVSICCRERSRANLIPRCMPYHTYAKAVGKVGRPTSTQAKILKGATENRITKTNERLAGTRLLGEGAHYALKRLATDLKEKAE